MSQPMGLLGGLARIMQIMQAEGLSWDEAQRQMKEESAEPESNVIAIDFRGARDARNA